MLFARFEIQFGESDLKVKATGEAIDVSRHRLAHEVKAITYHGLNVSKTADGWSAEVIVDI